MSQNKPTLLKLPLVNLATATRKVTTTGIGEQENWRDGERPERDSAHYIPGQKKAVLKTDREQTRARKTDRQKSLLSRAMGLDHREGGTESASLNS